MSNGYRMRKRKRKRNSLILIAVMLLLCILASVYIVKLAKAGNDSPATADNETEMTDDAQQAEDAYAEDPEAADAEKDAGEESDESGDSAASHDKAAEHVYSLRGSQGDDELAMSAYERAVEAGSKYLEADMVVSADGTVYVAHDDYAKDMTGINGYFSGMTDGQIDATKTRAGYNIIKMSDLFDKFGDPVTYLIDIKYTSARNITAFTELVQKYGYEDNVIATSFYPDALSPLEATFPEMKKLYVCQDQATFNAALGFSYIDIMCVPKEIMFEDNLKAAHDNDKEFSVWTLNTEDEIKSAIEMGVDSYLTGDSELAIKAEEEYRTE